VLGARALGRATLSRQLLLLRRRLPAAVAIERLVGMQAQVPSSPYVGLWSRLSGFRHEHLSDLLLRRQVVRIALMRSTIHLVTDRDCLFLRPLIQPVLDRQLAGNPFGPAIRGIDRADLEAAGRALAEEVPRTTAEIGRRLLERWPHRDPLALGNAVRNLVPLVQVPPRGVWGASGATVSTSAEAWLGRPLVAHPSLEEMLLRYLIAFGPATVADAQAWSGLTRLGEIFDRLRPQLRSFRDERGRELFDVPDGPRPGPDVPAPPRFLPDYDNVLLSHADRARIVSDDDRRSGGIGSPTVLVDGTVAATWKIERSEDRAALAIRPFRRIAGRKRDEVIEEGDRLLAFAAADAVHREIRIRPRPHPAE
jgi:winged helix DNA-binding protein